MMEDIFMKLKKAAMVTLALALTAGSAMTSMAAGWKQQGNNWRYQWDEGNYAESCWILHKNNWYYIGADGTMQTGWQEIDGKWYFMANTGEMINGLVKVDGRVYYMDGTRGHLYTGPRTIGGVEYHFTEEGLTEDEAPYVYNQWRGDGAPIRAFPIK